MAQPIATDLGTILSALKLQISNAGVFTPAAIYISLTPDDTLLPIGDQMAAIVPGRQNVDQGWVVGGGNEFLKIIGQIQIVIWTRLALDRTGRADDSLTDSSLGLIQSVTCLVNALQQTVPVDLSGNPLIIEPMRFQGVEYVTRVQGKAGRISANTNWEFSWRQRLSC